jgi:hypothetical protein
MLAQNLLRVTCIFLHFIRYSVFFQGQGFNFDPVHFIRSHRQDIPSFAELSQYEDNENDTGIVSVPYRYVPVPVAKKNTGLESHKTSFLGWIKHELQLMAGFA